MDKEPQHAWIRLACPKSPLSARHSSDKRIFDIRIKCEKRLVLSGILESELYRGDEMKNTLAPIVKTSLKKEIVQSLKSEKEITKIMIFGSFLDSETPNDIDVAIFQDSQEAYLPLALKYRKLIRSITRKTPVDIIPIRESISEGNFLSEIEAGELIYER